MSWIIPKFGVMNIIALLSGGRSNCCHVMFCPAYVMPTFCLVWFFHPSFFSWRMAAISNSGSKVVLLLYSIILEQNIARGKTSASMALTLVIDFYEFEVFFILFPVSHRIFPKVIFYHSRIFSKRSLQNKKADSLFGRF